MKNDSLLAAIVEVEKAHFRTVSDSGACQQAMLVMNAFRAHAGLPSITKDDLAEWDGQRYVVPENSILISNLSAPGLTILRAMLKEQI